VVCKEEGSVTITGDVGSIIRSMAVFLMSVPVGDGKDSAVEIRANKYFVIIHVDCRALIIKISVPGFSAEGAMAFSNTFERDIVYRDLFVEMVDERSASFAGTIVSGHVESVGIKTGWLRAGCRFQLAHKEVKFMLLLFMFCLFLLEDHTGCFDIVDC
jgi:hypothetical protein